MTRNPDKYTLVITDQMMPALTGLEMTHEIHMIDAEIPVILASGFTNTLLEEKSQRTGVAACLRKPISLDELEKTVCRVITTSKNAKEP